MIKSYEFRLSSPQPSNIAYPLYAAVLEHTPREFAASLHESTVTPVSQFVHDDCWRISVFGRNTIDALAPVLESMTDVTLHRDHVRLGLELCQTHCIEQVDELLNGADMARGDLHFLSPTAFKSGGAYQLLPTQRLVMQSLILKWNGCFGDICPIEDEGGGLDALAEGIRYRCVSLDSQVYAMKHTQIPGVLGTVAFDNRLTGFHRQLAGALLTFGTFSGLGIKTALGMGGISIGRK